MPNNNDNILTVSGPRDILMKFKDTISENNPKVLAKVKSDCEATIAKYKTMLEKRPNDKYIIATIKDNTNTLDEINAGTYKGNDLDFNGTVPMPPSLNITCPAQNDEERAIAKDNLEKYGHADWYSWCRSNDGWGTKWGAYDVQDVEDKGDSLIYKFQTAWAPPIPWVEKTSKLFPELTLNLAGKDEGGSYFCEVEYENGEEIIDKNYEQYEWRIKYEPEYKELYDSIFNVGYDKGIAKALELGNVEWGLEKLLLDFIKPEDLPLFASFEWNDDDVKEDYISRIKGEKETDD